MYLEVTMMSFDDLVLPAGVVALLGFSFLSGGNESIGSALNTGNSIKQLRQQMTIENVLADTTAEGLAADAANALERYKSGCIIHAAMAEKQDPKHTAVGQVTLTYQSIREGGLYKSWRDGQPYSPGACLADADGNTGIIGKDGTLTLHQYTGEDISSYVYEFFGRYDD